MRFLDQVSSGYHFTKQKQTAGDVANRVNGLLYASFDLARSWVKLSVWYCVQIDQIRRDVSLTQTKRELLELIQSVAVCIPNTSVKRSERSITQAIANAGFPSVVSNVALCLDGQRLDI